MPVNRLKQFLDEHGVKYVAIKHSPAYTAQEIAASAHVPGNELAKVVVAKIDGDMTLAVLPASYQIDLELLRTVAGAETVELPSEEEFKGLFPGCDPGAMPPFGNLYGMPVFATESLAEDKEICFNAGSHTELLKLAWKDFERLVGPTLARFSTRAA